MNKDIDAVKDFWERNPLFAGESKYQPGTKDFFEEHRKVYLEDVFANNFNKNLFIPDLPIDAKVLDLGCGVGFWTIEMIKIGGYKNMYSADLTQAALDNVVKRLEIYGLTSNLSIQNVESMTFENKLFTHINCQGVIHHTPNTHKAIQEISRILKPEGTAYISVYHKNIFLRNWGWIKLTGKVLSKLGAKLKGRGREKIFECDDTDEITRLYDGDKNPIGKSYSEDEIIEMVSPYFDVEKTFHSFFPARTLPFKIPNALHKFLSRNAGFMLHLNLRKKRS